MDPSTTLTVNTFTLWLTCGLAISVAFISTFIGILFEFARRDKNNTVQLLMAEIKNVRDAAEHDTEVLRNSHGEFKQYAEKKFDGIAERLDKHSFKLNKHAEDIISLKPPNRGRNP
jgi:hypothetical protein